MELRGRTAVLAQIGATLDLRRPVLVVGVAGSGRTEVLRAARAGRSAREVSGRDQVSGVPLAMMAPLVAAAGLGAAEPVEIYRHLPRRLQEWGDLLVVDDVDLADRGSAVLLAQAVRSRVLALASARAVDRVPHGLLDAFRAAGVERVDLGPLEVDDIAAVAAQRLGDELSVRSLARLAQASAGWPERVVEMIEAGAADARAGDHGVELGDDLLTPRLRARVAERLAGLSASALHCVELVCAMPRLPEQVLDREGLDEAVAARALRLPEVRRVALTSDIAAVAPVAGNARTEPMGVRAWDEVLRATVLERMGSVRVRDRVAEARTLLREHRADPAARDLLTESLVADGRPASFRADDDENVHGNASENIRADDVRAALERALREHRATDAGVLGRALVGDDAETLLARGRALSAAGMRERAAQDLRGATRTTDEPLLAAVGAELGLLHAVRRSDPATAVREVTEIVDRLGPAAPPSLRAELVKWRLMAGLAAEPIGEGDGRLAAAADRIGMAVIAAMTASMNGPVDDAARIVADGLDEIGRSGVSPPHAGDLLRLSGYLATAFDGRLDEAEELAARERDSAIRTEHPAAGMWEYASAELNLHAGRTDHSRALGRRAVRHLAWQDFTGLLPTAQALLAVLEARHGRLDAAADLAAALPEGAEADVKVALHLARLESVRRPEEAAALLYAAGQRAIEEQQALLGLMAIDEALSSAGRPAGQSEVRTECAATLAAHADRSRLVAVLADRARAVLAHDLRALEAAAGDLAAMGCVGRAADAWETAARWHRDRGAREAARRVLRLRDGLAADGAADGVRWMHGRAVAELSLRERQVAELASTLRNREIAERLGVSVRTVENHLARVFRKLDVRAREQLADALAPHIPSADPGGAPEVVADGALGDVGGVGPGLQRAE